MNGNIIKVIQCIYFLDSAKRSCEFGFFFLSEFDSFAGKIGITNERITMEILFSVNWTKLNTAERNWTELN